MLKLLLIVIILIGPLSAVAADGQSDGGYVAPELSKPAPGHLLDENYLTSTGQTVARPGIPQSSGETRFDRYIEQQNDRIDKASARDVEAPADRSYFRPLRGVSGPPRHDWSHWPSRTSLPSAQWGGRGNNSVPKSRFIRRQTVGSCPPCQINLRLPLSPSQASSSMNRTSALPSTPISVLPEVTRAATR